jgi:two-component system sensor histidine kinase KdpD
VTVPIEPSSEAGNSTRLFPKGHLKIFLGASPGVGKTFAMLQAAAERKAEGVDVVVGLVETHNRKETEEQLTNLEVLPRKIITYRGRSFKELDLDGVLNRAPQLVLIDECAHSNLPGSRHPKRYNDITEILEQGIDVYTTVNIQHFESLKDIVEKI